MAFHSNETGASLHYTKVQTSTSLDGAQPGTTPSFIGEERQDLEYGGRWVADGTSASTNWRRVFGPEYDAVVHATAGVGSHVSISAVVADSNVPAGARVLVMSSETVNTSAISITKQLHLVFKRQATITKGTSTTGISFDTGSSNSSIEHARFSGFTTAGDKPLNIATGVSGVSVVCPRFASGQDSDVTDVDSTSVVLGLFVEP